MNPIQLLQKQLGLKTDGVIGKKTFDALKTHWGITGTQLAHLLGQCEHETGGFRLWTENLNYSQSGLLSTFPNHYKDRLLATQHQRNAQMIANHVYGKRMGNEQPNDGWNFRGRGALQLTGRDNYKAFSEFIKDPSILTTPDLVATKYAFDTAVWFFRRNKLFDRCVDLKESTILTISRGVNIGNVNSSRTPHGMKDRIEKTLKYQQFI
jgi:putative chitinase